MKSWHFTTSQSTQTFPWLTRHVVTGMLRGEVPHLKPKNRSTPLVDIHKTSQNYRKSPCFHGNINYLTMDHFQVRKLFVDWRRDHGHQVTTKSDEPESPTPRQAADEEILAVAVWKGETSRQMDLAPWSRTNLRCFFEVPNFKSQFRVSSSLDM